jgi:hypothetical protein
LVRTDGRNTKSTKLFFTGAPSPLARDIAASEVLSEKTT